MTRTLLLLLLLVLWPTLAKAEISYNPSNAIEGDPTTKDASPALIGKTDTDTLTYLRTDSDGKLITTALTGFGADFTFGDVVSSSTAEKIINRTTYNEQTTNAQRSFSSSSANDSSAGTGSRTIQIEYCTATFACALLETVTLNGTSCVATSSSSIAYVDQIRTRTVGSAGANVGTITMYVGASCGGGTIGTIGVGDKQTFWGHHYVEDGKIANVTGVSVSHSGTTVGSGGVFFLRAKDLSVADASNIQVSDFVRLYGQSSTSTRSYSSPIKVTGPAVLSLYVTPETSSSTRYRGSFDFFQP